jgi:hypothetical protein
MCRLLYLPAKVRPPEAKLIAWLAALQRSFGGHGNGMATVRAGAEKGLAVTPEHSAAWLLRHAKSAAVWHTRRTSCGETTDVLCHPFRAGNGWLVHNGHWGQGAFTAKLLKGAWSDTKVAALFISNYGWEAFCDECYAGVWIHLGPKGRSVLHRSGDLWVSKSGALASEPCDGWGSWREAERGDYGPGERVAVKPQPKLEQSSVGTVPTYDFSAKQWKWVAGKRPADNQLFGGLGRVVG